jgi:flavin-dependent dehydrogenase
MNENYDVLIVGGGPAGLSTAFICHKQGLSYLVLESGNLEQLIFKHAVSTVVTLKSSHSYGAPAQTQAAPQVSTAGAHQDSSEA